MIREAPQFGKPFGFFRETQVIRETAEENNDVIPGQTGNAQIRIETLIEDEFSITIRVLRRNSLVPSTHTIYSYGKALEEGQRGLSVIDSYLYSPGERNLFLVERHEDGKEPESFPQDPQIRELVDLFRNPHPGESPDFSSAIEAVRELNHPAMQFIEDVEGEALLLTKFYTDTLQGLGVSHLDVSVVRFTKEEKPKISSLTTLSLMGADDKAVEPEPVKREFFYIDGRLRSRKQYVGDELIYTDTYTPRIINVEGKDYEIFDIERDYEEWAQRESGRKGEYRRVISINPKTGNPVYKFFEKK